MKLSSPVAAFAVALLLVPLSGCQGGQAANQDKLNEFKLPKGYQAQGEDPEQKTEASRKNVASQLYSIPEGVDPCADLQKAFRAWAEKPIKRYDNGYGCSFTSYGQDQMTGGNVDEDKTRVQVLVFNNRTQFPG